MRKRKHSKSKVITGHRIPGTAKCTVGEIAHMQTHIGARIEVRYNSKERAFVAFTRDRRKQRQLASLLAAFPPQNITVRSLRRPD